MPVETPNFWEWTLGAGAAVSGWLGRQLYSDLRTLQVEMAAHKLHVAENYVTTNDLADIKAMLHRIEEKLDGKQDK